MTTDQADASLRDALAVIRETAAQLASEAPQPAADGPLADLIRGVTRVALTTQLLRDPDARQLIGEAPAAMLADAYADCLDLIGDPVWALVESAT